MNRPNILFILTDDQRFDTIHALGNTQIKTPNYDRLTKMGTAFTHAHIPGGTSGAVCMPSRAMINSGRTLFHLYGCGEEIPKTHTTLGQCFKENGYETYGIGKWHNGTESFARSFSDGDNIFFGGMWDHWNVPVCNFHKDGLYETTKNFTTDFFHANHPMPMICDKLNVGEHSTDLFTKSALEFIGRPHDKPFFAYLAYLAPHDPRTMPAEFQNMYKAEDIDLPKNFADYHQFDFGQESRGKTRDEDLASYPRNEKEIKQHIADYYAMISHLDYNIGKLIDSLEQTGQMENTIIVLAGDNGLAVGQHGLMGKQSSYDHSVRVPLIMCGKGINNDSKCSNYVYLLDIYPTLCELAGIPIPTSVEGISFKPMLMGDTNKTREDLYFAYTYLIRAVKNDHFKLIKYSENKAATQLFDIQNDPHETINLYSNPEFSEVKNELEQKLITYRDQFEDTNHPHTKEYWS